MEVAKIKCRLRKEFEKLDDEDVEDILHFVQNHVESMKAANNGSTNGKKLMAARKRQREKLERIPGYIREQSCLYDKHDKLIKWPTFGYDKDCTEENTAIIDSFLFDEELVDEMLDKLDISRNYCLDCKSKRTEPMTFISHSLSTCQIEYMFTKLIPQEGINHVLDIGSRLGAIIYGASIFSEGSFHTTGIELNPDFEKLTNKVIKRFGLKNVEVVIGNVMSHRDLVARSQVIVMNNVFSFFLQKHEQIECWEFLHEAMQPGTILIHHPQVDKSLMDLDLSFDYDEWLELIDTSVECTEFGGDDEEKYEDCMGINKYVVKERH